MALYFVLISETSLVSEPTLYQIAREIERNARDCADAWHLARPEIDVIHARTALPPFCQPIVFLDDDSLDPGALAVHYFDPIRVMPAARVFVNRAADMRDVQIATGHEVCEALVDPLCGNYVQAPGRAPGVQIAVEVCDPVQDAYELSPGGTGANFVTPAYFDSRFADPEMAAAYLAAGGAFDRLGTIKVAGTLGPSGYAVFQQGGQEWVEPQEIAAAKPGAMHPWSRTARRLASKK